MIINEKNPSFVFISYFIIFSFVAFSFFTNYWSKIEKIFWTIFRHESIRATLTSLFIFLIQRLKITRLRVAHLESVAFISLQRLRISNRATSTLFHLFLSELRRIRSLGFPKMGSLLASSATRAQLLLGPILLRLGRKIKSDWLNMRSTAQEDDNVVLYLKNTSLIRI